MKLLLIAAFLLPVICFGQKEYKITSLDSVKGMTRYFTCVREYENTQDVIKGAWLTFTGMGKIPALVGRTVKYYPDGYGKRKTIFVLTPKKK